MPHESGAAHFFYTYLTIPITVSSFVLCFTVYIEGLELLSSESRFQAFGYLLDASMLFVLPVVLLWPKVF